MAIDQLPPADLFDVQKLLSLLTIPEKVSLLSGADEWQTQGIERLGIGSLKITDGPAGARGRLMVDGPKAMFLPAPVMQSATWSRADMRSIGRLLCKEAKSKSAQIVAAPTMCGIRNPLGGRNFETFSEDPYLTGALATEYVAGVQESGEVSATAKHFVANEQEFERFSIDAVIDEEALREIYLRPFEMLLRSSSPPGCVMTAYNRVNGTHMDMSRLVQQTLRDQWRFQGTVMSDWGGTNSTVESVLAGCDLEMPGPAVYRGEKLLNALSTKRGAELLDAVDRSCERLLSLAKRHGLLGLSAAQVRESRSRPEMSKTSREELETLRGIVANGHVLLKNYREVLPLRPSTLVGKKIAFVGPNAKVCCPGGGGSATMNPQYQSHPMEAFVRSLEAQGIDAEIKYALGACSMKWLPLASTDQWFAAEPGGCEKEHSPNAFRIDFFDSGDLSGAVFETQYRKSSNIDLTDSGPAALRESGKPYSLRVAARVRPTTSGDHKFSITSVGHSRLFVNGEQVIDNFDWTERGEAFYAFASAEATATVEMSAGIAYDIIVEAACKFPETGSEDPAYVWSMQPSVRLGFLEELSETLIEDAVATANESDYTIAVIGLNEEWESEGYDRQTMTLPGRQDELVEALLTKTNNPNSVIIVNQSGSAVEMPWADKASTLLQAWYGGQEAGNALADVLLGHVDPSGRLPFTWPKQYADLHFRESREVWPGVDGRVKYDEGCNVGYRWFQKHKLQPQWWLGHGLGYSSFETKVVHVTERPNVALYLHIRVENTGSMQGREVIQVYTWRDDQSTAKELSAFDKTSLLMPGDKEAMLVQVQLRDMARWRNGHWSLEQGAYSVGIGQNAGTVHESVATIVVAEELSWDP